MSRVSRPLLALLSALALVLGLGACGGGGGSTSSSVTATQGGSSTGTATTPSADAGGNPAAKSASSQGSAQSESASRAPVGAAKSFVKPGTDNSIPDFGSEAPTSDRSRAEAALRAYLAARAQGDWSAACSGLAASVRKQVQAFAAASKAKGCAPLYKAFSSGTPAAARANPLRGPLAALRIKGKGGFALFYGPKGPSEKYVMPMAAEGGAWKVTQLAPIAYPLGSQTPTSP